MINLIGIIGAMHEEIIELKSEMMNIKETNVANMTFFEGKLKNRDVVLVESGIGKVNSAVCTTLLIERFAIDRLIFTGVAGGVNANLNVGDIVISKDLIQHDVDATAFGAKYGEIPRMDIVNFKADSGLVNIAEDVAINLFKDKNIISGRILSGDQFISSMEKIEWLRNTFLGDCVEMEGAAVAHVCYIYQVPFVVLRAISDKADHSANVDFAKFVHIAAQNSKDIVLGMLEKME